MLLLPDSACREILGQTWHDAREVLPAMTIALAGVAAALGPICVLRAHAAVRQTLVIGLAVAALLLAFGTGGAVLGGATGAAAAFALAQWLPVPLAWERMFTVLRRAEAARTGDRSDRGVALPEAPN